MIERASKHAARLFILYGPVYDLTVSVECYQTEYRGCV